MEAMRYLPLPASTRAAQNDDHSFRKHSPYLNQLEGHTGDRGFSGDGGHRFTHSLEPLGAIRQGPFVVA